ncbi:integrase catalytic domain-containing protein [Trichonephila clavipes]|nr:integrase catalytic domain-containing protein [Trichonephila clavipes]
MKPPPNRVHFRPHSFPTLLEKVELRSQKCLYCNKGHELDACRSFSANEKREILRKKGCCYLCLSLGHRAIECVKRESCPICNGSHHFSICFRNRHDDDLSLKGDTDNIVSAVFKTELNSVLLQTCAVLIDDKNEQEVVRLFLDNGSQRSFVLKSTSEKFNFPILRKENLSICTFGAKETETKTLNIVKIKLKNRDDPSLCIEIEAVKTEHISITNLPTPDRNIDKKFRYLKNVQLADPYEFNDKEISILIGADYYYQVVTEKAFQIKSVPDELKAEILLNILGERVNNLLTYVSQEDLSNYVKIKELILREFEPTPQECLSNFKKARKLPSENYVQFASRLSSTFDYYCQLRKVNEFRSLCDLIISDKIFETLDRDTMTHIATKQGETYFKL